MVHGWPNQEWFPELLDLMIDFPLALSGAEAAQSDLLTTLPPTFVESQPTCLEVIKGFHKEGFSFWSYFSVAHKISEVSEQLPPSDIYLPPPPLPSPDGHPQPHSYPHAFQPLDIRLGSI